MVVAILTLLAIYGVCFTMKDTKGLSIPRNWIRQRSVLIDSLLGCSFCSGFWSGIIVYFVTVSSFSIKECFLFSFGGAALCYIVDTIMIKLEGMIE